MRANEMDAENGREMPARHLAGKAPEYLSAAGLANSCEALGWIAAVGQTLFAADFRPLAFGPKNAGKNGNLVPTSAEFDNADA
jgi:hypothetical protein